MTESRVDNVAKRILVLGGGTGGYVAARKLAEAARKQGLDLEVTVVADEPWHDFRPLYGDVALGAAVPDEVRASIVDAGRRFGFRVLVDRVTRIDAGERAVETEKGGRLGYDYLVVSLGVRYGWEAYPGLDRYGYHNYTLEGATELGKALARFKGGRIVLLVPETPHRCGMYPYEAVTQLAETMKNRGIKAEVVLLTRERTGKPLAALGTDVSRVWWEKIQAAGVEMVQHDGNVEVDGERGVVRAGNVEERYDLLIKVPPSRLPEPLARSEGFQLKQDPRWAPVRPRNFRHPDYDDVFMVGEHSMPPAGLPTAGIPVHFAADYAADQIISEITGGYPVAGYAKTMTCVGYWGTSGYAGTCEIRYDEKEQRNKLYCYTIMTSPIIRLMKEAFYKSWIAAMK
ncbi:hypothetical protein CF15_01420 [Pyrodictium occultum]|uniref:FAD/NAD(P)-binding domain-containing protein n=1 Tax=Pyrodictium occultum TaxID=2309 RepID=A0A0V8RTY9_PYROC|nr:FAD/NAD(P)-binding oxidoreductase [Pyrodictium occultum]KSW11526.1 hypothetical protein CF15_01420 [Pyrodictium occultum]